MPDPENTNAKAAGGLKPTSGSEAVQASEGKRSESDERRFRDALEDDEVRDALRVTRGTGSTPPGGGRP